MHAQSRCDELFRHSRLHSPHPPSLLQFSIADCRLNRQSQIVNYFSCTTNTSFRQPPNLAQGPRFVQVTVPSVVVPFTAVLKLGRVAADVPAVVAFSTLPF